MKFKMILKENIFIVHFICFFSIPSLASIHFTDGIPKNSRFHQRTHWWPRGKRLSHNVFIIFDVFSRLANLSHIKLVTNEQLLKRIILMVFLPGHELDIFLLKLWSSLHTYNNCFGNTLICSFLSKFAISSLRLYKCQNHSLKSPYNTGWYLSIFLLSNRISDRFITALM